VLVRYIDVPQADLVPGTTYEGGPSLSDEALYRLLGTANMGGIRSKNASTGATAFLALFSTFEEIEWPDKIDEDTGEVTYFGDNRSEGDELHSHPGNRILARLFSQKIEDHWSRSKFPPIFIFSKAKVSVPRSASFHGLAVPSTNLAPSDRCVAKYFGSGDVKFLNYVVTLTVLKDAVASRAWIDDLLEGRDSSQNVPDAFINWRQTGTASR
jgi:hypothetical protein